MGGVKLADAVRNDGEDAAAKTELCGLSVGETGGEAVDGAVVGVEEFGGVGGEGRDGVEDGGVPVVVGGENGWLLRLGDVDDVGLMTVR